MAEPASAGGSAIGHNRSIAADNCTLGRMVKADTRVGSALTGVTRARCALARVRWARTGRGIDRLMKTQTLLQKERAHIFFVEDGLAIP